MRKNVATLNRQSDDIVAFASALKKMRAVADPANVRSWLHHQRVHRDGGKHSSWLFLPWHRAYLLQLEAAVAALSGHSGFALPYWDWQGTSRLPALLAQPPFTPIPNHRIPDAATTSFRAVAFAYDHPPASIVDTTALQFYGPISAKGTAERTSHDIVHDAIGGVMSDQNDSPADPVFWFHHCNIDRVFSLPGSIDTTIATSSSAVARGPTNRSPTGDHAGRA